MELDELKATVETMKELTSAQNGLLIEAIDRAVNAMITEHGTTNLKYGDVFRAGRGGYSYPAGGGMIKAGSQPVATLRAFDFTPQDNQGLRWVFRGGHETRLTIYTRPIQSFTAMHLGQSSHTDSPHYSDQAKLLSERKLKPTYFNKEELLKHVVSMKVLDVYID